MKILLLGHMGRDEALADRLLDHELHIIGKWENPGLVEKAKKTKGKFYVIGDIKDAAGVAQIAEEVKPDMFLTNFDDALAAGVVDAVREKLPNILFPCPDQQTSAVEWDKFYLRQLIDEIDPKYNPRNVMVENFADASVAIADYENGNVQIALKPRNLTGGKGVKVMGKHFGSFSEGREYAKEVLNSPNQSGIEIQEKMTGHEFTLQIFTDGKTFIRPPVTHDYPYREDGDTGPGTGGMGTFSMADGKMPFLTDEDYEETMRLSASLVQQMATKNLVYRGVLYPSFFKTPNGIKIVEVNARGGDPELINILDLLEDDVDMGEVLRQIATGSLSTQSVRFKPLASVMVYLVSPDYGYRSGPTYDFEIDEKAVAKQEVKLRFAAGIKTGKHQYSTVGSSRTVGLSSLGQTPQKARQKILNAISQGFDKNQPLKFRQDVGSEVYLEKLSS